MTRTAFAAWLGRQRVIPLDGSWGALLAERGLPAGTPPEQWTLSNAEAVADVARAYAAAGARAVLTNTFGGSRPKLEKSGLADDVALVNHTGARLSREAVPADVLVCGSVGPTGEFLEPYGLMTEAQMQAVFVEQIAALVEGGVDAVLVETMTSLEEALCGFRAAREVAADIPVIVSMTYDKGQHGYATMMGVTPAQAAQRLDAIDVDVVGTNCGNGPDNIIDIVRELRACTPKPLWARPNAGLPQLVEGRTVFPASPEEMAAAVPAMRGAGATLIGGCCGTTPAHIEAMAAACAAADA
jgi:5-methyltetrahydrofolate--homocysteine methyltransferase